MLNKKYFPNTNNLSMESAFEEALVGESITDTLKEKFDMEKEVFNCVTHDDLYELCKTVAYKVFHNLKNGHEMDRKDDPLISHNEIDIPGTTQINISDTPVNAEHNDDYYENGNALET